MVGEDLPCPVKGLVDESLGAHGAKEYMAGKAHHEQEKPTAVERFLYFLSTGERWEGLVHSEYLAGQCVLGGQWRLATLESS